MDGQENPEEQPVQRTEEEAAGEPPGKRAKTGEEANDPDVGEVEKEERSPQLAKFWKCVEDKPEDFTAWTHLLQHVDGSATVNQAREAYTAFLHRYPYCYGYWKKYADLEKRKGSKEKCMLVFERGIAAIALSVDLWIHYLNYVKSEYEEQPEFVRDQFERAVSACGREWRSDKLWDKYVKWESTEQKTLDKALILYDRIVRNPTQGLSHQWEMFKEFVKENNPKDLLKAEDYQVMHKEVVESLERSAKRKRSRSKEEDADTDTSATKEEGALDRPATEEENSAMWERIIYSRKKAYREAESEVQVRWKYEDAIKRPYFHVKPLERGQLKNWGDYLDFEIKRQKEKAEDGEQSLVEVLFERCMIACALYEEFWIKYAGWLEDVGGDNADEKVRDVYRRATEHHLPDKLDLHLKFANFEERRSQFGNAAEVLKRLEVRQHPQTLSLMLQRINLERRRNNLTSVHELYRACIDRVKVKGTKSDLSIKYARFLRLSLNDVNMAKVTLERALAEDEKNPKLYLQLLDVGLHEYPLKLAEVIALLDRAIENSGNAKLKLLFTQRKVEFLEDFGDSLEELGKAQDEQAKLASEVKDMKESDSVKTPETSKSNGTTGYGAYQQYGSRYGGSGGTHYGGSGNSYSSY